MLAFTVQRRAAKNRVAHQTAGGWSWVGLTLTLMLVPAIAGPTGDVRADEPIVLAVHPYQPYETLIQKYTPLAKYLEPVVHRKVLVRVGKDYQDHLSHVGKDRVDIAVLGPASYVRMVADYGEKPLLARFEINGKPQFQGVIIARHDSGLEGLGSLKGRRFAFGDRESTMSHLVPRFMLGEAGIGVEDLADYQFLGSHDNVALAVLAGAFDAGAVKEEVFAQYAPRGLRAIDLTPPLSEHVLITRSTLSADLITTIREALYSLSETPEGRTVLREIKKTMTGMVPVEDRDYDNLRRILRSLGDQGIR